ncbi:MAG: hypothetical protein FJ029_14925 [Actinobacteria bacterium]|nr:hypothetical protein [Actinomycetota bacterium]
MASVLAVAQDQRPQSAAVVAAIWSFLELLWQPGDVRELRIPKYNRFGQTASGYFDSPERLARAAIAWDGRANAYVTLNPVNPALLARASNHTKPRAQHTTADADIVRRDWLAMDVDPVRPAGISSTDAEAEDARQVLDAAVAWLAALGWPEPIRAMSGNGYYALYRIDLPNDAEAAELVNRALRAVAAACDTAQATIDTGMANASRLVGLIGTRKVKGDATADRPHRRSRLE